jgi:hypothetical protein
MAQTTPGPQDPFFLNHHMHMASVPPNDTPDRSDTPSQAIVFFYLLFFRLFCPNSISNPGHPRLLLVLNLLLHRQRIRPRLPIRPPVSQIRMLPFSPS